MIDALTIKEWLAVYFTFNFIVLIGIFLHVVGLRAAVDRLFHQSQFVHFLKQAVMPVSPSIEPQDSQAKNAGENITGS